MATATLRQPELADFGTGDRASELDALRRHPMEHVAAIRYERLSETEVRWELLEESSWLSSEQEATLFQQMNLAFFRAQQLRDSLLAGSCSASARETLGELHRLLQRGERLRNGLATVFLKLANSIARGFVNERFPFDDLASEAHSTLLYAMSKFNPERGFRFSTYATYAIRRRLLRYVRYELTRGVTVDWQESEAPESERWSFDYERKVEQGIRRADELLALLTPRERYIVRSRFGWGRDFEERTLQTLADELGVSRERVRQVESRALDKMRRFARDPKFASSVEW